jgi:hypothetical protein
MPTPLAYLTPTGKPRPVGPVILCVLGVTALILLTDCVLYRGRLPGGYVAIFHGPHLIARILILAGVAAGEEMRFRLGVMTAVVLCLGLVFRDQTGAAPPWVFVAAILIAQGANVWGVFHAGQMPADYNLLRFFAPGLAWGWLCWRHGWFSALIAHCATHVILQPLLLLLMAP